MAAAKGNGFGNGSAKEPNTPVYPTWKAGEVILAGFIEFAHKNRDDKKLKETLGVGLEATVLAKFARMYKLAAECGEDLEKIAALYDRINGTASTVTDENIVSIPGPEHNGIGFYPIPLWSPIEWYDGEAWKPGFLANPTARDGRYGIAEEEDPSAEVAWVQGSLVRRAQ